MNRKACKLLRKVARSNCKDPNKVEEYYRDLKSGWKKTSHIEKTKFRKAHDIKNTRIA